MREFSSSMFRTIFPEEASESSAVQPMLVLPAHLKICGENVTGPAQVYFAYAGLPGLVGQVRGD